MRNHAPPTLFIQSGLHEERTALVGLAAKCGWAVIRRPDPEEALQTDRLAFYGDTYSGPRLVGERRYELLEPSFDLLACLPVDFLSRHIRYGLLGDLLDSYEDGFFKPADACAKAFHGAVYNRADALALRRGRHVSVPALFSEVVAWSVEFRLVVHRAKIVSVVCYKRDGRRGSAPLQAIAIDPELAKEAEAFGARLQGDPRVVFPPAYVLDVGLIPGRGWAVVEFNPLWCSRFFGAEAPGYLPALIDIIFDYGAVPENWRRWSLRDHAVGSC